MTDWSRVTLSTTATDAVRSLTEHCKNAISGCSMTFTVPSRLCPAKEWMTPGLVRSIRKRDKLHKSYRKLRTTSAKIEYDCYNRKLRELTRKMRSEYNEKKISEVQHDPRKTWRYINMVLRGKTGGESLSPQLFGVSIDNINAHFASIGERFFFALQQNGKIDPSCNLSNGVSCVLRAFVVPDPDLILKIMGQLKNLGPRASTESLGVSSRKADCHWRRSSGKFSAR